MSLLMAQNLFRTHQTKSDSSPFKLDKVLASHTVTCSPHNTLHTQHKPEDCTCPRGCLLIALAFSPSTAKARWLHRSFLASDVHSLSWWPFRRALSLLKKANNCIDIITLRKSLRKTKQLANLSAPSSKQKIRKANLRLFQPHSRDKFPFFFLYQNSSISFLFFFFRVCLFKTDLAG